MKLILHIGTEKTASTLLQEWLYANQDNLSQQRVFLSDCIGRSNNKDLVSCFLQYIFERSKFKSLDEKDLYTKKLKSSFEREIKAASQTHDVAIITSENFHSRLNDISYIQDLRDYLYGIFDEVKVICYLRPQADLKRSLYSTAVKGEGVDAIDQFESHIDSGHIYYNYYVMLNNWEACFGRQNLDIRLFAKSHFQDGDIRLDFIKDFPVAIDADKLNYDIETANESLSLLQSFAYRAINKIIPYWLQDGRVNSRNLKYKEVINSCEKLPGEAISDPLSEKFQEMFDDGNQIISEKYFGGTDIFNTRQQDIDQKPTFDEDRMYEVVEDLTQNLVTYAEGFTLSDEDLDKICAIAWKCEYNGTVDKADAADLLRIVRPYRPDNVLINAKLSDWGREPRPASRGPHGPFAGGGAATVWEKVAKVMDFTRRS